jgi:hypothetical protein
MRKGSMGVVLGMLIAGCGGVGSGDVCEDAPAPCGGDVIGSWAAIDTCFEAACPGEEVTKKPDNASTFTFRADGMAIVQFSITGTYATKQPLSCLTGTQTKCSDLSTSSMTATATCSGETLCTCTGTFSLTSQAVTVPYSASGPNVTIGGGDPLGYCVKGDTLYLRSVGESSVITNVLRRQ